MCPIRPDALWALDFQFDSTIDGRQVKLLNIIDEYTRECLAIVVDHSIGADIVVATLARLSIERGRAPAFVRFDNGPEFVSHAVADWCDQAGVGSVFIDPGSPWQNAWIESFNSRLRDELLNLWAVRFAARGEGHHRRPPDRLQHQQAPLSVEPANPCRLRRPMGQPQPTKSCIAPGPATGSLSADLLAVTMSDTDLSLLEALLDGDTTYQSGVIQVLNELRRRVPHPHHQRGHSLEHQLHRQRNRSHDPNRHNDPGPQHFGHLTARPQRRRHHPFGAMSSPSYLCLYISSYRAESTTSLKRSPTKSPKIVVPLPNPLRPVIRPFGFSGMMPEVVRGM